MKTLKQKIIEILEELTDFERHTKADVEDFADQIFEVMDKEKKRAYQEGEKFGQISALKHIEVLAGAMIKGLNKKDLE